MGKKITLLPEDSAIVIHNNCNVTLYIPGMDEENEDKDAPDGAVLAALVGILLKSDDKEFSELLDRKSEEYFTLPEEQSNE